MTAHGHRRQVLLFLVAIILPCVVLVVLGLRIMTQDRELRAKRLVDERRALAARLREALADRLEAIALREASAFVTEPTRAALRPPEASAVVLVARLADGRVTLPWDADPRPSRFRQSLGHGRFAELVGRGEHAEIVARAPGDAVGLYTDALAVARDRAGATYARLLRGRANMTAGHRATALRDYDAVLRNGTDQVDDQGIPLALYASARLLEVGDRDAAVTAALQHVLADPRWLSPTALYLMRDLSRQLRAREDSNPETPAPALEESVGTRLALVERALALQDDLRRLGVGREGGAPQTTVTRWVTYGEPAWLVGEAAPMGMADTVLVAVWADSVLSAVGHTVSVPDEAAIAVGVGDNTAGEPLGAGFPGLVVRLPDPPRDGAGWDPRRWFSVVALLLVISTTLFGGYFLSRDVRRELRLAELRSRFVSAVSHELKTPLTAIRMYAETLQLGRSSDPGTQREYLETIVNESERLTRLLNNVLDFSKIERGRKEYRPRPDDLADIVRASARAMRYPLEQQQFTLHLDVPEEFPSANVDRDAIEQAILNLLTNAMKYSGNGRTVDLRLAQVDGEAVIEVADRGVGIAPEEQEKIFDQFYRARNEETGGVPGTGLGLTLVRHIAEGHGGTATVHSTPGEGSTFTMHLPLGTGDP